LGFKAIRISVVSSVRKSLFLKLGLLFLILTFALIFASYYVIEFSYTEQDSILDAHECFYYTKLVDSWGNPPDTTTISSDLQNLKMWGVVYKEGKEYWRNSGDSLWFDVEDYGSYSDSDYLGSTQGVIISHYVSFGDVGGYPATFVDTDTYQYLFIIEYIIPNELINFVPSIVLAIVFMVGLFLFIRNYLFPIQLMKERVLALEKGDLNSQIKIIGEDELAGLSKTINKMVKDIKLLLEQKQRLLADVSHELRSPLARMQLLIELLPAHKNKDRLREQIGFLEGMISNLLISDKLSTPYSSLEKKMVLVGDVVDKCMAMVANSEIKTKIVGNIPKIKINVDEFKLILALRNLIDNALKYAGSDELIEIAINKKVGNVIFSVKDFGPGVPKELIEKLTLPFYRIHKKNIPKKNGFGLGLTICKKIIEAHGGELLIKNNLKQGATFSIKIPVK